MVRLILSKCPVLSAQYFWSLTCPDSIMLCILQSLSHSSRLVICGQIDLLLFPVSSACLSIFFWFAHSVSALVPFLTVNYPFSDLVFLSWRKTVVSLCWCGLEPKVSCGNIQSGKISKIYKNVLCPELSWSQAWEEGKTRESLWDPCGWSSWEPARVTECGHSWEQIRLRTLKLKRGKRAFSLLFWVIWLGQHELCGWEEPGFPGGEITREVASGGGPSVEDSATLPPSSCLWMLACSDFVLKHGPLAPVRLRKLILPS